MSYRACSCILPALVLLAFLAIASLASPPDRDALQAEISQLGPLEQEAAVKAHWYRNSSPGTPSALRTWRTTTSFTTISTSRSIRRHIC